MKERKKLSSARWLVIFFVTLVLLAALFVPVFNLALDPYGAFGDRIFGVGISHNIYLASIRAIICAINRETLKFSK